MAIENFDYQAFAQQIAQQAYEAMPTELSEEHKQFLAQTIMQFAAMSGESLAQDETGLLNEEHVQTIIQYISEWTYRKGLELTNSDIPEECWQQILQAVAGGVFEAGKNASIGGITDPNTVNSIIQGEVDSHYTNVLNNLKQSGAIDQNQAASVVEAKQKAREQIEIPQEAPQPAAATPAPQSLDAKTARLATVAMILTTLPDEKAQAIMASFTPEEIQIIQQFMSDDNMTQQIDPAQVYKLLNSLKNTIAPVEAPTVVAKHLQELASYVGSDNLAKLLNKERPIVQNFVKSCVEGKFIRRDFSPYLARSIYKYLEKQLSPV